MEIPKFFNIYISPNLPSLYPHLQLFHPIETVKRQNVFLSVELSSCFIHFFFYFSSIEENLFNQKFQIFDNYFSLRIQFTQLLTSFHSFTFTDILSKLILYSQFFIYFRYNFCVSIFLLWSSHLNRAQKTLKKQRITMNLYWFYINIAQRLNRDCKLKPKNSTNLRFCPKQVSKLFFSLSRFIC